MSSPLIAIIDAEAEALTLMEPNLLVPWLLMGAWAYDQGDPILSDAAYDELARTLAAQWGHVTHQHKHLITPPEADDIVKFCHVMLLPDQYPSRVPGAVNYIQLKAKWEMLKPDMTLDSYVRICRMAE